MYGGLWMEFRQLEYFCTISELENFTRTAEVLHVSQPSVTKAIKSLESELGVTLIDRRQKHVCLTEQGKVFLMHAQRIMQDAAFARKDMMRYRADMQGMIHFGMPPMIEGYLFPELFTKFQEHFPEITLDVQEFSDSDEVRLRAEKGDLDFGIVLGEADEQPEHEMMIMRDRMILCLPPGHPLAAKEEVSFHDLQHEKFIMQQPNTYQYQQIMSRCGQYGFVPDIVLCTSQLKTIKQLVANGVGLSVLPEFVTRMEQIFVRRPLKPSMELRISLFWGGSKALSRTDTRFMDFIRNYAETPEFKQSFRQH